MIQGALWDVVVVGGQVLGESGVEVGGRSEAGLPEQVADSAVEAFDHAVGLGVSGWAQTVLDVQGQARSNVPQPTDERPSGRPPDTLKY